MAGLDQRTLVMLAALAVAAACLGEDADAEFRVLPGEFTATIASFEGGMGTLTIAQDGRFEGSPSSSWAQCEGQLTNDELEQVADSLSRADALHAVDTVDPVCDGPWYEIALFVVEGPWSGQENRFRVDGCNLPAPLFDLTQELVPALFERASTEDGCTPGLYCDLCEVDNDCRTIPDAICIEGHCCDAQQMMCTPELCRAAS